eukprot:gene13374-16363_t
MARKFHDPSQLDLFGPATDERTPDLRKDGGSTLAGVLPATGARTGADGPDDRVAFGGAESDARRNGKPDAGLPSAGPESPASARSGVGTGSGEIHPPPTGGNLDVARNQANYRLTAADRIGEGSLKQKFRQNVAAIELLRTIEDERRPATDAEKAVLVKYIGWGGMPQVFAEPDEAPDWKSEQARMKELLTDDEYRSARASTLNAHYT